MRKIDQIKPDGNNIPIHVQARGLGADIAALKKEGIIGRRAPPAAKIAAVWDYRAAGMNVDAAREHISEWYGIIKAGVHPRQHGKPTPRILHMYQLAADLRELYLNRVCTIGHGMPEIRHINQNPNLKWDRPRCKITEPSGRIIISTRIEDVEWDRDRRGRGKHWPTKKSVYYQSRLLRADYHTPPGTLELLKIGHTIDYQPIEAATERTITHDARGNWVRRVVVELLGESAATDWEAADAEFFAAEAEAHAHNITLPVETYKIVEQNGCLRSVFKPDFCYPLGEWVEDPAVDDHGGGVYCYLTPAAAISAARSASVFDAAWAAGKTLVLCRCEALGNRIAYGKKYAFDRLRIVEVVQPITHN